MLHKSGHKRKNTKFVRRDDADCQTGERKPQRRRERKELREVISEDEAVVPLGNHRPL
jgi:hypothetical protein